MVIVHLRKEGKSSKENNQMEKKRQQSVRNHETPRNSTNEFCAVLRPSLKTSAPRKESKRVKNARVILIFMDWKVIALLIIAAALLLRRLF